MKLICLPENGPQLQQAMASRAGRSTVPQVFVRGQHVGGCDDTLAAQKSGKLLEMMKQEEEEKYDYDLIVIGGGSGGLAASKVNKMFLRLCYKNVVRYNFGAIPHIIHYIGPNS